MNLLKTVAVIYSTDEELEQFTCKVYSLSESRRRVGEKVKSARFSTVNGVVEIRFVYAMPDEPSFFDIFRGYQLDAVVGATGKLTEEQNVYLKSKQRHLSNLFKEEVS